MLSDRSKARGYAALKALFTYVGAYIIIAHYFMVLKWNSVGPGGDDHLGVDVVTNPKVIFAKDTTNADVPSSSAVNEFLKTIQAEMQDHQDELESTVGKAQDLLEDLRKKASKWSQTDGGSLVLPAGSALDETLELKDLLLHAQSLSDMKDDNVFQSRMEHVRKQLKELADKRAVVRWSDVHELLSPEAAYSPKEKLSSEELKEMLCLAPEPPEEDAIDSETLEAVSIGGEVQNRSMYASEDDLEVQFSVVETILNIRLANPQERLRDRTAVQTFFEKLKMTFADELRKGNTIVINTVAEITGAVDRTSSLPGQTREKPAGCTAADKDDVMDLVQAGLDALARHQDLRSALLVALEELDSASAKNLILDADFGTNDPTLPMIPIPDKVPVQRLIDKPLLSNLAPILDRFVDIIGGYNDSLDHYVDQLQERLVDVDDKDASSLGKVFVSTLLKRSGHLEFPIPEPLKDILRQTRGGRALLASLV